MKRFSILYILFLSGLIVGCSVDTMPEGPGGDLPEVTPPDGWTPPEDEEPIEEPIEVVLSEVTLKADGPGDTYELINSVLANTGYNIVEAPDCSHESFGRHIDEVFDESLDAFAFRFMIHATPDNDRCKNFDRQRNEIKTYDKSPENTKGIVGEKIRYTWKFKLPSDFQSSKKFTHIHQLKAVGGSEDSMPLMTLATRKSTPDQLELRYAEHSSQITLKEVDLEPFLGAWVEVTETVIYGEKGQGNYAVELKSVASQEVLFSYEDDAIRMWKTDADFIRPKWGVYRSLVYIEDLKDEEVLFADFSIEEIENE